MKVFQDYLCRITWIARRIEEFSENLFKVYFELNEKLLTDQICIHVYFCVYCVFIQVFQMITSKILMIFAGNLRQFRIFIYFLKQK